ncbi:8912_t:CDS:2, partial [Funneliformis geosporum]
DNQISSLNIAKGFQGKAVTKIGRIENENCSIAGSEPVDNAPVASNAKGSFSAITIASDIKLG